MSDASEIAKAIQESAKFGTQSAKAAEKLGGFFARVFKESASQVAGIVTDRLRFVRWKRLCKIADKVNTILESRGVTDSRAVPPKLALPILEDSSLEEDENLAELWTGLLANAMDPNFKDELRYAYTDIIRNLTPLDAHILRALYNTLKREDKLSLDVVHTFAIPKTNICQTLGLQGADYLVSANNLMRLRCIAPYVRRIAVGNGLTGPPLTTDMGSDVVTMTPLGITFVRACAE